MAVRRAFAGFVNIVCRKTKKTRNLLQIRKKRRNFAAANKSICRENKFNTLKIKDKT